LTYIKARQYFATLPFVPSIAYSRATARKPFRRSRMNTVIAPTVANRRVALWLFVCAALVFAMVVLGGVTRLTRSGLSIVEWKPVTGAIPPIGQAEWQTEFDKYKKTPEYQKVNRGMTLNQFKSIFWVEYAHRLLGRTIGFVFLVPFLYFAFTRQITRSLWPKLLALFMLGGLQGGVGWLMVASGLVDRPHVSPFYLTGHLGFAVVIYGLILWIAWDLWFGSGQKPAALSPLRRLGWAVTGLVYLMILTGGFVAGTKAGFVFNTFPLMNGHFVPEGLLALEPTWVNFFENVATVQFDHRLLAYLLCLVIPAYWFYAQRFALDHRARIGLHLLLLALVLQVALGITTLLLIVPVWLGAAHQGGALLVFSAALYLNFAYRRG